MLRDGKAQDASISTLASWMIELLRLHQRGGGEMLSAMLEWVSTVNEKGLM
jgi:hypothetical protein